MEVWGIIEQDHQRLKGLMERFEHDEPDNGAIAEFKHSLTGSLEAEAKAIYAQLRLRSGFAKRIADVDRTDELLRRLCGDLARAGPAERGGLIRQMRAALDHHMHEDSCMFPVAMRELQFYLWEDMKHRYESAKRAAIRSSKGEPHLPEDLGLSEALESLRTSHDNSDAEQAALLLGRILRIERGHVLACQTAIDRAEESSHRSLFGEIAEDHLRAVRLLGEAGTETADGPEKSPRPPRAAWMRVVWSAMMGETSLLKAVAANERQSGRMYAQMLSEDRLPHSAPGFIGILASKAEEHAQSVSTALTG